MTSDRRPHIDAPVFRDTDGQPIPFSPDGEEQGSSAPLRNLGREERAAARARLAAAALRGWQPWPLA